MRVNQIHCDVCNTVAIVHPDDLVPSVDGQRWGSMSLCRFVAVEVKTSPSVEVETAEADACAIQERSAVVPPAEPKIVYARVDVNVDICAQCMDSGGWQAAAGVLDTKAQEAQVKAQKHQDEYGYVSGVLGSRGL